jgi:NAD(P)H-hydrate epimerase
MGLPKFGLLRQPGMDYTGELNIADIGFPDILTRWKPGQIGLLENSDIASLLPKRKSSDHKGSAGRLLVLAGSTGMTGAAVLSSDAALKCGAGLVTLGVPESLNPILEAKITEVMTLPLPETGKGAFSEKSIEPALEFAKQCGALAIGPGVGREETTQKFVQTVIEKYEGKVVLDADGIYAMAAKQDLLKNKPLVMTPHPGELAHFLDISIEEVQERRFELAEETARNHGITLVLKGAHTVIASPEGEVCISPAANSAMATAGMGDVLTGLIAALLAQGLEPYQAAQAGVFCHGKGGEFCSFLTGYPVFTASEVLEACRSIMGDIISGKTTETNLRIPLGAGLLNPQMEEIDRKWKV